VKYAMLVWRRRSIIEVEAHSKAIGRLGCGLGKETRPRKHGRLDKEARQGSRLGREERRVIV